MFLEHAKGATLTIAYESFKKICQWLNNFTIMNPKRLIWALHNLYSILGVVYAHLT